MPSYPKHVPTHRAATPHRATKVARHAMLKTSLTLSSMAVVATGVAVATGSLSLPAVSSAAADGTSRPGNSDVPTTGALTQADAAGAVPSAPTSDAAGVAAAGAAPSVQAPFGASTAVTEREQSVTRSDERDATDSVKADSLNLGQGNTLARSESLTDQSPQVIAQALLGEYGWSQDQFSCLDSLWTRESGWNVHADNPSSSAYGIPQALPGSKMSSAGADWANNAVTQITWGLGYISERYGSPCGAWSHSQSSGFY